MVLEQECQRKMEEKFLVCVERKEEKDSAHNK